MRTMTIVHIHKNARHVSVCTKQLKKYIHQNTLDSPDCMSQYAMFIDNEQMNK